MDVPGCYAAAGPTYGWCLAQRVPLPFRQSSHSATLPLGRVCCHYHMPFNALVSVCALTQHTAGQANQQQPGGGSTSMGRQHCSWGCVPSMLLLVSTPSTTTPVVLSPSCAPTTHKHKHTHKQAWWGASYSAQLLPPWRASPCMCWPSLQSATMLTVTGSSSGEHWAARQQQACLQCCCATCGAPVWPTW